MFRKIVPNQFQDQKTISITINLSTAFVIFLIAGMLLIASIGFLSPGKEKVHAADANAPQIVAADTTSLRRYYRTANAYTPISTTQACAAGFHFASMWELVDPSNLEYAGELNDAWSMEDDQGEGPPAGGSGLGREGWVRTGYNADTGTTPGQANCSNWTSNNGSHYGTSIGLSHEWGVTEELFIWNASASPCNWATGVWCIED